MMVKQKRRSGMMSRQLMASCLEVILDQPINVLLMLRLRYFLTIA